VSGNRERIEGTPGSRQGDVRVPQVRASNPQSIKDGVGNRPDGSETPPDDPGKQDERTAQSGGDSLGSQQQDDRGGIGGQGLGSRRTDMSGDHSGAAAHGSGRGARPTGQTDDNQDDMGRDVNDKGRASTNNRRQ
jgi:hypothetical protein